MPYSQQAFYGQTINNLTATKILGNSTGGSFTRGTSAAWTTGAATGTTVTFTSSTPSSNATNLTATPSAPAIAPTITVSDGGALTTETAAVTFKPLAAGQTLTLAGLTFTAGATGATATQLATAFQNIAVGTAAASINTTKTLNDAAGGTFTAGPSASWATGAASGSGVTFTSSTTNSNVTNLSSALAEGTSAPSFVVVEGAAPSTNETSTVTFKALATGQTLSLAGLTFTAGTNGATAVQVASAFASITAGTTAAAVNTAKTLNDAAGGTFTTGTSADWASGVATAAAVTFSSTTANTNVTNLAGTLSLSASAPTITVTEGSALASTETATVTFQSMTAGQTLAVAGLTFTAGTLGATAEQVANAFANIALGTTSTNANNIPPTMASAYVVTPGVLTNSTSLSGYISKADDGNTYTFLATGTFTVTANSLVNTKIAAVKGSITSLKIFTNGALADSISYGTSVDTTLFGVTDSSVNPPTNAILTAQRAQAALQFNSFLGLLNSGSSFIGSDDSIGGMDQVQGGTSMDRFTGNTGNDYFDGKAGIDTASYRGVRADYFIGPVTTLDRTDPTAANQVRAHTIIDSNSARDGIDTLVRVERLQFADTKIALDLASTQSAGQTALLLGAVLPGQLAFDVTKQALLGSVIGLFDQNFTLAQLSGAVLRLPIWEALTGIITPTTADIATYLVHNVYAGTETAAITNAAITAMNSESRANQGAYLASLAASTANQTHIDLVGKQAIGLEYLA